MRTTSCRKRKGTKKGLRQAGLVTAMLLLFAACICMCGVCMRLDFRKRACLPFLHARLSGESTSRYHVQSTATLPHHNHTPTAPPSHSPALSTHTSIDRARCSVSGRRPACPLPLPASPLSPDFVCSFTCPTDHPPSYTYTPPTYTAHVYPPPCCSSRRRSGGRAWQRCWFGEWQWNPQQEQRPRESPRVFPVRRRRRRATHPTPSGRGRQAFS